MSKETFAIINDQDQVVNHIVVGKDAPDFEQVMADQLAHWGCVRYVETTLEDVIILDEKKSTIAAAMERVKQTQQENIKN